MNMKRLLGAASLGLLGLGSGTSALAQDWTGFYLNGGFGYGSWSADTTTVNNTTGACVLCVVQTQGGNGWLGKVGAGYDHQINRDFLVGALIDYDFSDLKGSIQDQGPYFVGNIKQKSAWAAGARIGWLPAPSVLAYLNAGYSHADFSSTNMVTAFAGAPTGFGTPSFSQNGWFAGIGMEANVAPGWSVRAEYRFASYGTTTLADYNPALGVAVNSVTFKPVVQTGTIQVAYKFAGLGGGKPAPGPVASTPQTWTGFYANGGFGYGSWTADTTTVFTATGACRLCYTQTQGGNGWLGKIGVGYDYQFHRDFLVGALADYDFSDIKGTIQDQDPFWAADIKQKSAWALGARLGWLATRSTLAYFNAGWSHADFSDGTIVNTFGGVPQGTTPSFSRDGWFAGIGMEAAVVGGWFVRAEYRYADYSSTTIPQVTSTGAIAGTAIRFSPTVQTGTVQAVYKF